MSETELTPAEQLLYNALRLNSYSSGQLKSRGTGFVFNFTIDEHTVPVIVTNKHVVSGSDTISIIFHLADAGKPSGDFIECKLKSDQAFHHPDSIVDLCALPIGPIVNEAEKRGTPLFYRGAAKDIIPPAEDWQYFDAIENVTMVGCPRGIIDEVNNLPIIRRGITASPMFKDYEARPEFMVDMACFPGSSGSPVFIFDQNGYLDRKEMQYRIGASRLFLVGILYSGPLINNEGKIVMEEQPSVEVASMMHLGSVIKSTELQALETEIRSRFLPSL